MIYEVRELLAGTDTKLRGWSDKRAVALHWKGRLEKAFVPTDEPETRGPFFIEDSAAKLDWRLRIPESDEAQVALLLQGGFR
jgi:hypothetical protein